MSLIPEISDPFIGAFVSGLFYGLAVCTASCLPIVAGYIAGVGSGFRKSVRLTLFFNSGRVLAYAFIGALIGLFGGLVRFFVSETVISPFQVYSSLAFGVVTIIIGGWLLHKTRAQSCDCKSKSTIPPSKLSRYGIDFGAFILGLTRGLIICPPLIALLAYSLSFASPLSSIGIAVVFGLGTTISPILLLGGITGWLLNKAPLLQRWISVAGGVILIALGVITVLSSLIQ
jgi:sulfite exporter TauE/SafE